MSTSAPPSGGAPPNPTDSPLRQVAGSSWYVCHTRPRCEKRFTEVAHAHGWPCYLPLIRSVRRYSRQTKSFTKPLFPGYVFTAVPEEHRARAFQRDHLVRMIRVGKEEPFLHQLAQVRRLVDSGLELSVLPLLRKGHRVRITAGPLWGVEGIVEDPLNPRGVIVSVDVLRQGVLVRFTPDHLELLPT